MPHYKHTSKATKINIQSRVSRPSNATKGKDKGEDCQASPQDRIYATRNRSHKYPGYEQWTQRKKG